MVSIISLFRLLLLNLYKTPPLLLTVDTTKKFLLGIFVVTLFARLVLAFATPTFTYESYFHLRHVEHITNTGLPLFQDPLSYGGRELHFLPFFHYLAAFFDLFLPLDVIARILPNLYLALLVPIVFLISYRLTSSSVGSLFSAGIAGFLPILFTPNAFLPESLFLMLIFLATYAFLRLPEKKYIYLYLISFFLASLTSPATFLLLLGFVFYLLLSIIEGQKPGRAELELIVASLFFYLWTELVFFNKLLMQEGAKFIWQNVPTAILPQYYPPISIAESLVSLSILPLLAGVVVIYHSLFQQQGRPYFLLVGIALSTGGFIFLRFLHLKLALGFLGVILAILFAAFYEGLRHFLNKTKIVLTPNHIFSVMFILLLVTTVYPALSAAFNQAIPSSTEIEAFQWLEKHSEKEAAVLALVQEGHLISAIGRRKNLMDDQFSLVEGVEKRFQDLNTLYTTSFQTQAISLLENYKIKYIVVTNHALLQYQLKRLKYLSPQCFHLIYYRDDVKIYELKCSLEKK